MTIEILVVAQKELDDAVLYYEMEQHGLGLRFKKEVRKAIDRIKKYPTSWPIERSEVRKCFVHKFPYKILYSLQEDIIVILAFAHQHRKPGYWTERLI
ncbi:MAG: type II toxin-antitoxin system RelE/ParE family toxin [bacterium]|nr:type II toxin-antitoxin system RelE/ParE family toxin [bacterium]